MLRLSTWILPWVYTVKRFSSLILPWQPCFSEAIEAAPSDAWHCILSKDKPFSCKFGYWALLLWFVLNEQSQNNSSWMIDSDTASSRNLKHNIRISWLAYLSVTSSAVMEYIILPFRRPRSISFHVLWRFCFTFVYRCKWHFLRTPSSAVPTGHHNLLKDSEQQENCLYWIVSVSTQRNIVFPTEDNLFCYAIAACFYHTFPGFAD
jgi:hypothetical protein